MAAKRIAIIGSNGFISSVLINKILTDKKLSVLAVDNGYKPGDSLLAHVDNPRFTFRKLDITNRAKVKEFFEKEKDIDGIILLAGVVGLLSCQNNPSLAWAVNDNGWQNIMEYKPENMPTVVSSTGSVYGQVKNGLCQEDVTPTNPLSIYGQSKLNGETWATINGGVALRFATCAGVSPNMRLNLMPNQLVYEAVTNRVINVFEKDNMRTFIDIRDFCDALLFFLKNFKKLRHKVYNVGDPANNMTKGQLAELIKEKTDCFVNYVETFKDEDARSYQVDYSRMLSEGFTCKYTLEDTIDNLIKSVPLLNTQSKYN